VYKRQIEARAQEPIVRGVRLVAIGEVTKTISPSAGDESTPRPIGHRRIWVSEAWQDDAAVYDLEDLTSGATIDGPAALQSAYTTMILQLGDRATCLPDGNIRIALG